MIQQIRIEDYILLRVEHQKVSGEYNSIVVIKRCDQMIHPILPPPVTPQPASGKIDVKATVTNITKNIMVQMSGDIHAIPAMKVSKDDKMRTVGKITNGTNKPISTRIEDWLGITLLSSIGRDDPNHFSAKEFFILPNEPYTFTSEWVVPPHNFGKIDRIDGAIETLGFQFDYKSTAHHLAKMKLI